MNWYEETIDYLGSEIPGPKARHEPVEEANIRSQRQTATLTQISCWSLYQNVHL